MLWEFVVRLAHLCFLNHHHRAITACILITVRATCAAAALYSLEAPPKLEHIIRGG
jgi:hypothetical protein